MEGSIGLFGQAALITGSLFGGLSFVAFTTKKDFSFLGGILTTGFIVLLVTAGIAVFTGGVGLWIIICAVGTLLAAGNILYSTSNMIHHYNTQQYVAASLSLFASIALMLWYVIQLLLISRD